MPAANSGQTDAAQPAQPLPQQQPYQQRPYQQPHYQQQPHHQPHPPHYQPHPPPYPWSGPVPGPKRPAAELGVLIGGSAFMLVFGGLSAVVGLYIWAGIFLIPEYSAAPQPGNQRFVASVLFPGPAVALAAAWAGYGILRGLRLRVAGVVLFAAVLLAWFVLLVVNAGPVLL